MGKLSRFFIEMKAAFSHHYYVYNVIYWKIFRSWKESREWAVRMQHSETLKDSAHFHNEDSIDVIFLHFSFIIVQLLAFQLFIFIGLFCIDTTMLLKPSMFYTVMKVLLLLLNTILLIRGLWDFYGNCLMAPKYGHLLSFCNYHIVEHETPDFKT